MAAIVEKSSENDVTISTDMNICQDDENGERIIAEAKWYLPGFRNTSTGMSVCKIVYFVTLFAFVAIITLFLILPFIIISLLVLYALCAKKEPRKPTQRLYLTQTSIVYKMDRGEGSHSLFAYHRSFRINLDNILHIKAIGRDKFQTVPGKIEVRAHDVVIFQLKEDSPQQIHYSPANNQAASLFTCCNKKVDDSVDSFAFMCHNGEEFVQAVKEQMASS